MWYSRDVLVVAPYTDQTINRLMTGMDLRSWLFLALAIFFEVAGTTSMKFSEGFTHLFPSLLIFLFYALAFTALTFALREMDLSVAYAIWAGVGTGLITLIGVVWFNEPLTFVKLTCLALIIVGVAGLNLSSGGH
jgi:small multidrug resistance pump